jgi:hypothetical protein
MQESFSSARQPAAVQGGIVNGPGVQRKIGRTEDSGRREGLAMWRWLFGFGGANLGALVGLAASILLVGACSASFGEPSDLGTAILMGFGTVLAGLVVGAIVGAHAAGRGGPPKS